MDFPEPMADPSAVRRCIFIAHPNCRAAWPALPLEAQRLLTMAGLESPAVWNALVPEDRDAEDSLVATAQGLCRPLTGDHLSWGDPGAELKVLVISARRPAEGLERQYARSLATFA